MIPRFRAWSKKNRCMIPHKSVNYYISMAGNIYWNFGYDELMPVEQDDYILMLGTGLKDINGREVFEGDIIEGCIYIHGKIEDGYDGEVFYKKEAGCFAVRVSKEKGLTMWLHDIDIIAILGNVHQNPELLGRKL